MAVGSMLKEWRRTRRMSQSELAIQAEVSTRHLSFVENERSRPSEQMILVLASALDIPLRERNLLLRNAGYPPAYRETPLDDPAMAQVNRALDFLLAQAHPNGAAVVDRQWNVLRLNDTLQFMMQWLTDGKAPSNLNLMRATYDPDGFRPYVANWEQIARAFLVRLRRDVLADGDDPIRELYEDLLAYPGVDPRWATEPVPNTSVLVPIELVKGGIHLRLFTTLTTLGTATDITSQELRIEHYFPADEATDALVRSLMGIAP